MIRFALAALLALFAPGAEARAPRVLEYERSFANALIEGDGPSAFLFVESPLSPQLRAALGAVMAEPRYRYATAVVVDVTRYRDFASEWAAPAPSLIVHYADDYVRRVEGPIDAAILRGELDRALATPVSRANRRGGGS